MRIISAEDGSSFTLDYVDKKLSEDDEFCGTHSCFPEKYYERQTLLAVYLAEGHCHLLQELRNNHESAG